MARTELLVSLPWYHMALLKYVVNPEEVTIMSVRAWIGRSDFKSGPPRNLQLDIPSDSV